MAHQHHRNSRDDKSKSPRKRVEKDSKFDKKRSDDKPKFSDKKFGKTGDKPFAKSGEKSYSKSGDRPFAKSGEKSYSKSSDRPFRDREDRPFAKSGEKSYSKSSDRPFRDREDRPFAKSGEKSYSKSSDRPFREREDRPFAKSGEKSYSKSSDRPFREREDRPFAKSGEKSYSKSGDRPFREREDRPFRERTDKPFKKSGFEKDGFKDDKRKSFHNSDDKPFRKTGFGQDQAGDDRRKSFSSREERPFRKSGFGSSSSKEGGKPSFKDKDAKKPFRKSGFEKEYSRDEKSFERREYRDEKTYVKRGRKEKNVVSNSVSDDGTIRLNRYISNSGICSRRKADELIEAGVISVNGEVISELGFKVDPAKDQVKYNGELLKREKKIYVLLNKPKDYITTTDDPQERRTVMQLVAKASKERIYPVGRLDRNTTGLLLMTNDGDLADKLSHPKHKVTKIYNVELNKNLTQGDFNKISFGLDLEDGFIKPDNVSYVTGGSKKEIGIQIHSGKNRIVRRIFEHLGYDVVKLDRVVYANLTKKDLPRGKWRFLQEHELIQLKHLL